MRRMIERLYVCFEEASVGGWCLVLTGENGERESTVALQEKEDSKSVVIDVVQDSKFKGCSLIRPAVVSESSCICKL